MSKNILLTGGNGYIGSHTVVEILKNEDYNVIIIDNLINSNINNINLIKKIVYPKDFIFYQGDILNTIFLEDIF